MTSLLIMEVILEKKQSLGTLAREVKIYPQLLKNVRVTDKKTARENPAVQEAVQKAADELGSDGRILGSRKRYRACDPCNGRSGN